MGVEPLTSVLLTLCSNQLSQSHPAWATKRLKQQQERYQLSHWISLQSGCQYYQVLPDLLCPTKPMLRAGTVGSSRWWVLHFQGKKKKKAPLPYWDQWTSFGWQEYYLGVSGKTFDCWAEVTWIEGRGGCRNTSLCSCGASLWVRRDDMLRRSMEAWATTACATLGFWGKLEISDLSDVNSELLSRAKFPLKGKDELEWSLCLVISYLVLHHPLKSVSDGQKETAGCCINDLHNRLFQLLIWHVDDWVSCVPLLLNSEWLERNQFCFESVGTWTCASLPS